MTVKDLAGKRVAVLGAGREGAALVRYLLKHGVTPVVHDQEAELGETKDELTAAGAKGWVLGQDYLKDLSGYDTVFRSPGIPWLSAELEAARKAGVAVTSLTRLFFEACPAQIVGVSGTKGKGTTAGLLYEMLKAAGRGAYLGGNIGTPPVEFLDELKQEDIVVLELSSFQLQDLEQSPHGAILTNLTADHLDHHHDVAEYHAAKSSLVRFQGADDFAVFNAEDKGSKQLAEQAGGETLWFSHRRPVTPGAFVEGESLQVDLGEGPATVAAVTDINIPGPHNLQNVLAASVAARRLGVEPGAIKEAIKAYHGLAYHLELVGEREGIKFFNDSYATNPTATIPAIESFTDPIVWVAGGYDKGLDYAELAEAALAASVKVVLLIGPAGERIEQAVRETAQRTGRPEPGMITVTGARDLKPALKKVAVPGDVVLFSPAAASFGWWFDNYRERGKYFTDLVTGW